MHPKSPGQPVRGRQAPKVCLVTGMKS